MAAGLLLAGASALGVVALAAGPAGAASPDAACGTLGGPICPPTATFAASSTETGGTITVTWTSPKAGFSIDSTSASLAWTPSVTSLPALAPIPLTQSADLGACAAKASPLTCTYQWPTALMDDSGTYILNGTYTLTVSATDCLIAGIGCSAAKWTTQEILVENPPAAPTGVTAALASGSTYIVNIGWAPNPEPDIVGYQVVRSDGSVACNVLATSPNPTTYSCTDVPPKNGSFTYTVVAHRWGPSYSPAVKDEPASAPSAATKAVAVSGVPSSTTTTVPAGGGSLGPKGFVPKLAPSSHASGAGPSSLRLSSGASAGATTTTVDPGFAQVLPYAQQPAPPTTAAPDPAAISTPPVAKKGGSVGTIAVVGAGLLIAVLAMHGLWLRAEVNRSGTLEALDPEN